MIPLLAHQRIWTLCCMCSFDKTTSKWKKFGCMVFASMLLAVNFVIIPTSSVFIIKFISTDKEGCLHALLQITAYIGLCYFIIVGIILRHRMTSVFENLAKIYKKYSGRESYHFLIQANEKSEWMWQVYFKYMVFTSVIVITFTLSSVLICWRTNGTLDATYLYHPYKVVLPWDVRTPLGYTGEIFFHMGTGQGYLLPNGMILLLFIALCLHNIALSEMYDQSLRNFKRIESERGYEKFLCELIEFQNTAKGWLKESAEAYSPVILIQLIFLVLSVSSIIFELDLQIKHFGFDISVLVVALINCFSNPFVFCFFSQKVTDSYGRMSDQLFESNWRRLPLRLQKYLILIIGNMQQPLYYHGFGVIVLNLETFNKLVRTIISYYMAFKTLTSD